MGKAAAPTKPDRRSERTRRLLGEALVTLMQEKSYKAISVQDIVNRANIGRSTFYARYRDKDDLLASQLGWLVEELSQRLASSDQETQQLLPSLELFRHVQQHYAIYKTVVAWGQHGLDRIIEAFQVDLSKAAERRLRAQLDDANSLSTPLPVLSNYVAGSFLSLLKWWLDNNMVYSPERMDELFQQLVMPGVQAALHPKP